MEKTLCRKITGIYYYLLQNKLSQRQQAFLARRFREGGQGPAGLEEVSAGHPAAESGDPEPDRLFLNLLHLLPRLGGAPGAVAVEPLGELAP